MKRTTATNNVSGQFVDRDPSTGTLGTYGVAEDKNNLQEEICHPIELLGVTLDGTDQYQLEKAMIGLGHIVGELVFLGAHEPPVPWSSARNNASPSGPKYFPAIPRWDGDHDITSAMAPLLVAKLYGEVASFCGVDEWSGTVSGTGVTLPSSASSLALCNALIKDAKVSNWFNLNQVASSAGTADHATTTSKRCLTVGGVTYGIAGVNSSTLVITLDSAPGDGNKTVQLHPNRIAGYTDRIRLHRATGMTLVGGGDSDGEYAAGLRSLDAVIEHRHRQNAAGASGTSALQTYVINTAAGPGLTNTYTTGAYDSTENSATRTGKNTNPRALSGYLYTWAGALLAYS